MGVRPDRDTKGTSQTKVSNLQCAVLVNQEVLWLKVTVEHTSLVAEEHPFHQLIQVTLSNGIEKQSTHIHTDRHTHVQAYLDKHWVHTAITRYAVKVLFEVHVHKLKDQIELLAIVNNLLQTDRGGEKRERRRITS